ncbi:MAG TPA: efflux transporter outer membrane subunit [Gemmataceae bacterium]|nr:efflux transporter outer membrane subunit [Gemmataceae bacterium]
MWQTLNRRIQPHGALLAVSILAQLAGGCGGLRNWLHNDFKVGPNFEQPPAPVAPTWIDAADPRVAMKPVEFDAWWDTFNDPALQSLIDAACRQNLDLRTAATRVLQAQAQRNIAAGNLFPQSQTITGNYANAQLSKNLAVLGGPAAAAFPGSVNLWSVGFNATWELDFWGNMRRNIESADAQIASSIDAYNNALVTLLGDVATNYVQLRTFQQRVEYAKRNVEIQKGSLALAEARLRDGKATALDVMQAKSSLAQTESSIPPLMIGLRQANDRLCTLLGVPPQELVPTLGEAPIPIAPPEVAAGIPAELIQRRPDVRRALDDAMAQSAQIGVAEADFYPQFGVMGFFGFVASDFSKLFNGQSFTSLVLPNFSWKIMNYGRILNNVRYQDAKFQEKVLTYQQTVLTAGREVEDALVAFLQYQMQAKSLEESVKQAADAVELVQAQYKGGLVDFNRLFTAQLQLVAQQDQLAAAQGNIAVSLIAAYRALGGGWQSFQQAAAQECPPAPRRTGWLHRRMDY